jgi:nicotinate-nucleotide adenylyltransferase
MKKIGIYGGTFDPIHCGHLILARAALEQLDLERITFVPAAMSPHKRSQATTPAAIRLEMLRAAIEGEDRFALDESELKRPPPSFAIDTVEEFLRREAQLEIFYLIGADQLPGLESWHRIEELRRVVQFVVLNRGARTDDAYLTIQRQVDISATEIRNRVATQLSIRYLVPRAVEEIIHQHQLYREPQKSPQKI